jgi:hypothetical protein
MLWSFQTLFIYIKPFHIVQYKKDLYQIFVTHYVLYRVWLGNKFSLYALLGLDPATTESSSTASALKHSDAAPGFPA